MKKLFLAIIITFMFSLNAGAIPIFSPVTGHYYERIDSNDNWHEAKSKSEQMVYNGMPGHLATITSDEENSWIVNNLGGALTLDHWLGGYWDVNSTKLDEGWHWVTGEPWQYTNWWPGEPSSLYENALQFDDDERSPSLPGFWNDLDGNNPEEGFIVEWDTPNPIPEPSTILLLCTGLAGLFKFRKKYKK